VTVYYLVTDLWFDPVAGQNDPIRGQMVGFAQVKADGSITRKSSTTLRGLASQQYAYADLDYIALAKAKAAAVAEGDSVVSIRKAHEIRRRPKIAGL
jgi:hypothetical protein